MTSIGENAFEGCTNLTAITVDEGNTKYDSRSGCNAIIRTSSNALIVGCAATIIPESVTSIEDYAFEGCTNLTDITIPKSVTYIGRHAFAGCTSLTAIIIPEGVTSIEDYAFFGCTNLTDIIIPEGVTSIEDYAFDGCTSLTDITIPKSVTYIGRHPFSDCSSLTNIIVAEGNTKYDSRGGCNAIIETSSNALIVGCAATIIPESVTSIGYDAFYNCSSLTSITIPEAVTSIGESAFYNCSNLTSITLPESVTSIGFQAFYGCTSLTDITIPEGVTSIRERAFEGCTNLISITCWAVNPPQMNSSFDYGVYIYVPKAALSAYKTDSMWSSYSEYIKISGDIDTGDVTYLIVNPSFEGAQYNCDNGTGNGDLNSPEGWQVTYTNADWGWKNFKLVTDGNEQDGAQYFEFWGATYHDLDLSQKLYNLPAGEYTLTAAMRTERADQVTNQHIYAKTDDVEYSSATLGAPIGSAWNSVDAWQTLTVKFTLDSESAVVIGAASSGGANSAGWFQIDNFRLTYNKDVAVTDIQLNQTTATLTEGETLTLTATVAPDNATDKTVTWSSSNTAVATVDSNGRVTAKSEGVATITATAGNKSVTCRIEVIISNDIDQLEKEYKGQVIYDLTGRRVEKTVKGGVYIVNGRKVVIK